MAYFRLAIFAVVLCLIAPSQGFALPSTPTYTNGGEIRLNSQLQRPFDRAQRAINNCDEAEYNSAVNSIREQQEQLESQADDEPNEWRSQTLIDQAGQMAVNAQAARTQLAAAWAAKQPCGGEEAEEPKTETAIQGFPTRPMTVVGSSPVLFDKAVNDAISMANTAIAECNRGKFLDAMDWLDELAYNAPSDAGEDAIDRRMDDLERQWRAAGNKKTCFGLAYPTPLEFIMGAHIGASHHGDLPGFVANEVPGFANTRAFEVIDPDKTGIAFGFNSELRMPLNWWFPNFVNNVANINNVGNYMGFTAWDVFFELARTSTRLSEVNATYDANGLDTLFPGVGGTGPSPAGYSVGAANGDITNINYKRDSDSTRFSAGFGQTLQMPNDDLTLRPFGGLNYGHTNIDERFAGVTNAGTLNFAYESKISTHNTGGFVGVEAEKRSPTLSRIFQSDFRLKGDLRLGYEYIDAKASDGLIVSGVLDQNNPVEVNDDGYFANYRASVGAVLLPDGLPGTEIEFGGAYERRADSGTLTRDGTQDSNLSIEHSDNFIGSIRAKLKF